MIILSFDKRQAEWVVCAFLAKDARMIEVVEKGLDPHTRTGHLISGAPEDLIQKEHKLIGHSTDPFDIEEKRVGVFPPGNSWLLPRTMSIRQCGKKSNHAFDYDESARRFSLENETSEAEAKRIRASYFDAYPGLQNTFWEDCKRELNDNARILHDLLGNKRSFYGPWGHDLFKQAYAYKPQSTVAEIVKRGMLLIYNDTSKLFQPSILMTQVHDSVDLEYPTNSIENLALITQQSYHYLTPTLHYAGHDFIIETDLKVGFDQGNMVDVPIHPNDTGAMILALKEAMDTLSNG